ncbi:MAG: DUF4132 domain-containing protein [Chthoniobacter sp.]|uniref:DUF4132 domain-containing protein n=1 Tax=Chthoniobacter sp. TaxID=2510640 RepID=UPI0032AB6C0D
MWDWLKKVVAASPTDGVETEEARRLLAAFNLFHRSAGFADQQNFRATQDGVSQPILAAPPRVQALVTVLLFAMRARENGKWSILGGIQDKLLQTLLRKNLPLIPGDLDDMLEAVAAGMKSQVLVSLGSVLGKCEVMKEGGQLSEGNRTNLQTIAAKLGGAKCIYSEGRKIVARITQILDTAEAPSGGPPLDRADAWAALAEDDFAAMAEPERAAWRALLTQARTASAAQPAARWLLAARPLVEKVGPAKLAESLTRWSRVVKPRSYESRMTNSQAPLPLHEANSDVLKGLVWCCASLGDSGTAGIVADLAAICYRKVPGVGPISSKVGNACLVVLEKMGDLAAVAQLSRLRNKIKYVVAQRLVQRALETAAANAGMTVADLEEIALPTFGLHPEDGLDESLASFTAEIRISPAAEVNITWRNADGKAQQSVPAEVKSEAAKEWKELKNTLGEIGKLLDAQRHRLERLCRVERTWRYADWRERYLDHPLVAPFARRLIWRFAPPGADPLLGIWHEGRLVSVHDGPLPEMASETVVTLWHPITSDVAVVQAWRAELVTRQVTQPFKQAHREIYVLTDAERTTGTYSNRFAAHILRQHQFAALAHQRGWTYRLQGAFDSANTPELAVPEWNLRAEFWVESGQGHEDISDSGIYVHMATDQVRILRDQESLLLSAVPPLIFSEIMRDVDLFVGVCSVGNDPAWADRGAYGPDTGAWGRFAFGVLTATAETRRDVLTQLVPKLKIAAQCSFEERFLVVRGELRTYKIHLGSGNILMAPNDQYLCIVPARGGKEDKVFLPFEGDATLSIILSKAFLLAADAKITDSSILSQIRSQRATG